MGISRPGDMGFDIVHFNLHKTFTQPHGGGGPGSGPIAVSDRIEPFLPRPQVVRREGSNGSAEAWFDLDYDRPKSIGRLRGFHGNFGVFVRSYAYICSLGADGLKEASETAVLNANYLKALLGREGIAEYLPIAFDRHCMHEFVLSGRGAKKKLGIKTLDIAKRLLDHEVHPPTVYFPLLVDEALMIEPTETEPKERLDHFADAIQAILEEAKEDPEVARNAPYTTPVRRLDEARAAKRPVVAPAALATIDREAHQLRGLAARGLDAQAVPARLERAALQPAVPAHAVVARVAGGDEHAEQAPRAPDAALDPDVGVLDGLGRPPGDDRAGAVDAAAGPEAGLAEPDVRDLHRRARPRTPRSASACGRSRARRGGS